MRASGTRPCWCSPAPPAPARRDWAARLAEQLPVEIVSVDSALVYRGLDIGTAKPPRELRARVPHHLIDICEPTETYSAGRFVADVVRADRRDPTRAAAFRCWSAARCSIFRALWRGIAPLPQASPELRRSIDERAAREGWAALHAELARLRSASRQRASIRTIRSESSAHSRCATPRAVRCRSCNSRTRSAARATHRCSRWALVPANRDTLQRASRAALPRDDEAGFLDEVRGAACARRPDRATMPAVRAVGYRQLWAHLDWGIPARRGSATRHHRHPSAREAADDVDSLRAGSRHGSIRSGRVHTSVGGRSSDEPACVAAWPAERNRHDKMPTRRQLARHRACLDRTPWKARAVVHDLRVKTTVDRVEN